MANNKHDRIIGPSLRLGTVPSGIVSERAHRDFAPPGRRGHPPLGLSPLHFKHHDPTSPTQYTTTPGSDFDSLSPDAADLVYPIRSVVSISQPLKLTPSSPNTFWGSNSPAGSITDKAPAEVCIGLGIHRSHSKSLKSVSISYPGMTSEAPSELGNASVVGASSEDIADDSRTTTGGESKPSRGHPEESYVTTRFEHKMTGEGHCVITGISGSENMQRCEDEPIRIPGAVQGFGVLVALKEDAGGKLGVKIVSEVGFNPTSRKIYWALCGPLIQM